MSPNDFLRTMHTLGLQWNDLAQAVHFKDAIRT